MESELRDSNARWNQAWFDKDADTVQRLTAEDYVYVGPNGMVLDRQAILQIVRSPSYRLDHGAHTEVVIRALGPQAAIVRRRWQGTGSYEGTAFTEDHRCVTAWEQRDGDWRIVFEQCSYSSK